jgi:hypothetical protein
MKLRLGSSVDTHNGNRDIEIVSQVQWVKDLAATPWGRAEIEEQLGFSLTAPEGETGIPVDVTIEQIWPHAYVVGASGMGKSRTLESLMAFFARCGYSLVVASAKEDILLSAVQIARYLDMSSDRVYAFLPRRACLPRWNVLGSLSPVSQIVSDVVTCIARMSSALGWGYRMESILVAAITIVCSARAAGINTSLAEVLRFLTDEDYRNELIRIVSRLKRTAGLDDALAIFEIEFSRFSKSEQAAVVGPVCTRLHTLLRSDFLQPVLTSLSNSLDMASLWTQQSLVVAHLDDAQLGMNAGVLGGLLGSFLYNAAMRMNGTTKVVFVVDEVGKIESYLGSSLTDLLILGRSQNVYVCLGTQFSNQLSDGLRQAAEANATLIVSFRQSDASARQMASFLSGGVSGRPQRISVSCDKDSHSSSGTVQTVRTHQIMDGQGNPLQLSFEGWEQFIEQADHETNPVEALRRVAMRSPIRRLYVYSADRQIPVEIGRYVQGVLSSNVEISESPLELDITHTKLKVSHIDKPTEAQLVRDWANALIELPRQHAVIRLGGVNQGIVKIADVPDQPWTDIDQAYLEEAKQANCLSSEEIDATREQRRKTMDDIAMGRHARRTERESAEVNCEGNGDDSIE